MEGNENQVLKTIFVGNLDQKVGGKPASKFPFKMVGLCEDILPNILCYLSVEDLLSAEKVCRCWHRVALRVWSLKTSLRFGLHGSGQKITQRDFNKLMRRCGQNLIEIDSERMSPSLEMSGIQSIVKYCPKLESLTVTNSMLKNEALVKIAKGLPELRKIVLLNCKRFTEKGFECLFMECCKLEYIHISSNNKITGECFVEVGPEVRELVLCDCLRISSEGYFQIGWNCPILQTLCLDSCGGLTDRNLSRIYSVSHKIKKLKVRNMNYFVRGENSLDCIKLFSFLVDLNLSANEELSDWDVDTITCALPKLQRLDISDCYRVSDYGAHRLVRCRELIYLNISNLQLVTGDWLFCLSKNGRLEEIICKGCISVKVKYYVGLVKDCPLLRLLDVTDCWSVSHWLIDAAHLVILQNRSLLGPMLRIVVPGTKAATGNENKRFIHRFLEVDATL